MQMNGILLNKLNYHQISCIYWCGLILRGNSFLRMLIMPCSYWFSVWRSDLSYKLFENRKHGINLEYNGYVYRRKISYNNTINWVCSRQPDRTEKHQFMCPARCITNVSGAIKLGKRLHNHGPVINTERKNLRKFKNFE